MRKFYVHVRGKYIGTVECTLAEFVVAFPYAEISPTGRVHVWAMRAR